jgi:hypothetical protein
LQLGLRKKTNGTAHPHDSAAALMLPLFPAKRGGMKWSIFSRRASMF